MKLQLTDSEKDSVKQACGAMTALSIGYAELYSGPETKKAHRRAATDYAATERRAVNDNTLDEQDVRRLDNALRSKLAQMVGSNQFDINNTYEHARSVWFKLYGYDENDWQKHIKAHEHPPTGLLLTPWLLPRHEIMQKWVGKFE